MALLPSQVSICGVVAVVLGLAWQITADGAARGGTDYLLPLTLLLDNTTHTPTRLLLFPSPSSSPQPPTSRHVTLSLPLQPAIPPLQLGVHAGNWSALEVPPAWLTSSPADLKSLGVQVHSSSGVTLATVSGSPCASSAAPLIPAAALGTSYTLVSFLPRAPLRTVLHIIGTQNDTTVNISQPTSLLSHQPRDNNEIMQIGLNAAGVATYESQRDMTGFRISANNAIAVYVQVESGGGSRGSGESVFVQQVPVNLWGCTYLDVLSTESRAVPQVYRITAEQVGTHVRFRTRVRSGTLHLAYSVHTDLHVARVDSYLLLQADKPVLVARYSPLCPSLHFLPGLTQWAREVSVPAEEEEEGEVGVVIQEGYIEEVAVDGVPLREYLNGTLEYTTLTGFEESYVVSRVPLTAGLHTLTAPRNLMVRGPSFSMGYLQPVQEKLGCGYTPSGYKVVSRPRPQQQQGSGSEVSQDGNAQNRDSSPKVPLPPVVYRIETLGASSRPSGGGINLREQDLEPDTRLQGSGPSVIAVVVSLSVAVFFVIICIVGFVVAEFWGRRETIGRVKVAPYIDPY